jgi:DNA invertase Pin-like site-specific DNA recombinase
VIVGYARVSTLEQNLELQRDALERAGCERVFEDQVSGVSTERPGWAQVKAMLRSGDTVVVWRLDRLGRSLKHLIETVTELGERGVGFRSVQENLDTTSAGGRLVFHIFGALAEFERELIQERTRAGLAAARARGRKGGRPRKLDAKKIATARRMLGDPEQTVSEVAQILGVSRATLYRALKAADAQPPLSTTVGAARSGRR